MSTVNSKKRPLKAVKESNISLHSNASWYIYAFDDAVLDQNIYLLYGRYKAWLQQEPCDQ